MFRPHGLRSSCLHISSDALLPYGSARAALVRYRLLQQPLLSGEWFHQRCGAPRSRCSRGGSKCGAAPRAPPGGALDESHTMPASRTAGPHLRVGGVRRATAGEQGGLALTGGQGRTDLGMLARGCAGAAAGRVLSHPDPSAATRPCSVAASARSGWERSCCSDRSVIPSREGRRTSCPLTAFFSWSVKPVIPNSSRLSESAISEHYQLQCAYTMSRPCKTKPLGTIPGSVPAERGEPQLRSGQRPSSLDHTMIQALLHELRLLPGNTRRFHYRTWFCPRDCLVADVKAIFGGAQQAAGEQPGRTLPSSGASIRIIGVGELPRTEHHENGRLIRPRIMGPSAGSEGTSTATGRGSWWPCTAAC